MESIDQLYRAEAPYVLATLIRLLGSFELAEEAVQMAFLAATEQWPRDGRPANPRSWLVSAGRFRAIDALRRRRRFRALEPEVSRIMEEDMAEPPDPHLIKDDLLRLIFTCCHPAIPADQQVALCLREVCGLTTEAIAAAFLVKAPTMAQRIVRAKGRIKDEGLPYEVPGKAEMGGRLETVFRVIYLVFSEGYASDDPDRLLRAELCQEAIRLARLLRDHVAGADIDALLGLMLLQHARRDARLDSHGDLIPLDEQDRALWHRHEMAEGRALTLSALRRPPYSTYALQAAIAATHADTVDGRMTDWTAVVRWYDLLRIADPGPVVDLNRAIAIGMRDGPETGLALVDAMAEGGLANYRYVELARADFLRRLDKHAEATSAYLAALGKTRARAERRFIERRLAELKSRTDDSPQPLR